MLWLSCKSYGIVWFHTFIGVKAYVRSIFLIVFFFFLKLLLKNISCYSVGKTNCNLQGAANIPKKKYTLRAKKTCEL